MDRHKKQNHNHPKENKDKEDKEDEETTPLSFAQMEGRCYCCRTPGHNSPECRTKDKILKYEWAINKAQKHVQSKNYDDKITSGSILSRKKEDLVIGWKGLHSSFAQEVNTK